jgi:hypothetical protein
MSWFRFDSAWISTPQCARTDHRHDRVGNPYYGRCRELDGAYSMLYHPWQTSQERDQAGAVILSEIS